jgi:energy-coupling factor transport system ATP-binding protein
VRDLIEFKDVSFSYAGVRRKSGVKNLNFQIKEGETVLLCGGSGSGKSTVTRLINGLCPYFYEGKMEGDILIHGQSVRKKTFYEKNADTGSVFQNPRTQFFNTDADSEVVFGCENLGISREIIEERFQKTVEKFRLQELLGRSIFEFSGGEQQRIACASAYCTLPSTFLLDEPSSNLDEGSIEMLTQILSQLKEEGKTIILAEHRLYYLMDLADRIFYMEQGEIKQIYEKEEFLKIPRHTLQEMGLRSTSYYSVEQLSKPTAKELYQGQGIQVKHLKLKEKACLNYEDIYIPKGEITAIIGKNGVGKTSFITALAGLTKRVESEIWIEKERKSEKNRLKDSYVVMQDVNHQLFVESVEEEILVGNKQLSGERLNTLLEQLDLKEVRKEHPLAVSGGQKQRTAIAAAISSNKKILYLDEPTSGLDYGQMLNVSRLLKDVQSEVEYIIVVTHDVEFIESCCTCVLDITDKVRKQEGRR